MKEIKIKTSEEIENISSDTIKLDAVEISRIQLLEKAQKLIENEIKAYKNAILDKYGHKATDDGKVKITISDYMTFDSDAFIAKYGKGKYDELKIKPVHRETVKV